MFNILITDDHPIFREGIKVYLNNEVDFTVCCEAESGEEALKLIMDRNIDVVILDIGLPGRNGLDILKDIRKFRKDLPVLVFSMYPEESYAIRAFRAGADGYLSKESFASELVKAIHTILHKKKYITEAIAEQLAEEIFTEKTNIPHSKLSEREMEVIKLIAEGKSIKNISEILNLSPNTVNTYRKRIMDKMSMRSNVELAVYAYKNKILD
ncbi:response regulator UvrY [bacterium BMS3Abin04]|nr:response regulator UvrY [bacterium BMS3Abin04]